MKVFDFTDWELTQDTLQDVLDYDPKTGEFRWLVKPSARVAVGQRAGSLDAKGYRVIGLANKVYKAHRLAWLYVYGEWPVSDLDFINRDPACIRIKNLRPATKSQNGGNAKARKDGLKGAHFHKRSQRWQSSVNFNGKQFWLGYFDTEAEAHAAYCKAARKYYSEFFSAG